MSVTQKSNDYLRIVFRNIIRVDLAVVTKLADQTLGEQQEQQLSLEQSEQRTGAKNVRIKWVRSFSMSQRYGELQTATGRFNRYNHCQAIT